MRALAALVLCLSWSLTAADLHCACDPSKPESMLARQCSLGVLASKEPANEVVFFVHDNSPLKPNRWLALPRQQVIGEELLGDLPTEVRTALWTQAIAKAKSLWGDQWGIAYNGDHARSQCQAHLHIGKLIEGVESG